MKRSKSQLGRMSRNKGAGGERELARLLTKMTGITHIRASQRNGRYAADVITDDPQDGYGVHWECKRTEKLNLQASIDQAERDKVATDIPVVAHRKNEGDWLVIVKLDDLTDLVARLFLAMSN